MVSIQSFVYAQSTGVMLNARVYLEGALMDNGNALLLNRQAPDAGSSPLESIFRQNYIPLLDPYKFEHANLNIVAKFQSMCQPIKHRKCTKYSIPMCWMSRVKMPLLTGSSSNCVHLLIQHKLWPHDPVWCKEMAMWLIWMV